MTASVGVSPVTRISAPAGGGAWWRPGLDGATTPARLRLLLALLVLLCLAWGVLAALTADQHASAAADVVAVSEPLSLDAEQIYTSLSDADATAANAFLAGGLEPAAARQRYQADITQAAIRIEAASALVGSSAARTQLPGHLATQVSAAGSAIGDDLATLSGQLPAYTGEVGTARADNRLGLPLGAAYLREASALSRGTLLTSARDIYTRESALLTSASAQGTGLPLIVVAVLAGLGLGYVFWRSSRWLARHTHRVVNYGLLLAALAGLVSLVWLAGAFVIGRADLLHAQQQGSGPAQAFARAEVAALQAHADESLTLIDNSGDDAYQQDYLAQQKLLGPGPGTLLAAVQASAASGGQGSDVAAQARAWYQAHAALRAQDDAGSHAVAVTSAQTGDAATAFARLSKTLSDGIASHQATFDASARGGRDAFTALAAGMIVAALVMVAGCVWGLSRRLAEYR
jgi:hypothetical protein